MTMNTTVEPIVFKQEFSPQNGWLSYGLVITILMIVILVLAKKYKSRPPELDECLLIEKKHLDNKTIVYVIEYQQQRFLLADNQQALAIHPIASGEEKGKQPFAPTLGSSTQNSCLPREGEDPSLTIQRGNIEQGSAPLRERPVFKPNVGNDHRSTRPSLDGRQ